MKKRNDLIGLGQEWDDGSDDNDLSSNPVSKRLKLKQPPKVIRETTPSPEVVSLMFQKTKDKDCFKRETSTPKFDMSGVGPDSNLRKHTSSTPTSTSTKPIACRAFAKGRCQYDADSCMYSHVPIDPHLVATPDRTAKPKVKTYSKSKSWVQYFSSVY